MPTFENIKIPVSDVFIRTWTELSETTSEIIEVALFDAIYSYQDAERGEKGVYNSFQSTSLGGGGQILQRIRIVKVCLGEEKHTHIGLNISNGLVAFVL